MNYRLMKRWQEVEKNEIRFKEYYMDDAKIAVTGFGTAGRIALSAVRAARAKGIRSPDTPNQLEPIPQKESNQLLKKWTAYWSLK